MPPARRPGSLAWAAAASSGWLDLKDDYWDTQGRKSIDAVAIFAGLLTMGTAASTALQELRLLPQPSAATGRRDQVAPSMLIGRNTLVAA